MGIMQKTLLQTNLFQVKVNQTQNAHTNLPTKQRISDKNTNIFLEAQGLTATNHHEKIKIN